jgi:hypothetical protein
MLRVSEAGLRRTDCTSNPVAEVPILPKSINSTGLQIADLLARPIGLSVLRPDQPNRTTDVIHAKYHRRATGMIDGYGRHILA